MLIQDVMTFGGVVGESETGNPNLNGKSNLRLRLFCL
jgi:hypothetical protein